ncbi:MAG TPA: hypothetical protein VN736_24925 [Candidatus Limnocylindrales bacterium]|nr:hypothetical protein [Candidatus Limnocylindrales bacterium]
MRRNGLLLSIALALVVSAAPLPAATFGQVVTTIGGHPSDIALDESRGQLYIANFTACEIDVMSTATHNITTSINYSSSNSCSHAAALALSLDSRFLVVVSYQNGTSTPQGADTITLIDLANNNARRTFGAGDPPLGVAFAQCPTRVSFPCSSQATGVALIATTTGFYMLDPATGYMPLLTTYSALTQTLPITQATFPGQVLQTAMTTSADTGTIWGIADAGTGSQLIFRYNAATAGFFADNWVTSPPLLPRVSVASDGSWALIGWSLFTQATCNTGANFAIRSRYPQATASKLVTGHAVNAGPNGTDTIYAQINDGTQPAGPPYYTSKPNSAPILSVMDAANMTVRERLYLPENLVGRALLSSDGKTMYAISDSGISVLPVGSLSGMHRLAASQEDVRVQTNFCNRNALTATFTLTDPGGGKTDFSIFSQNGVQVSPQSGTTPALVTVTVQLGALATTGGTLSLPLTVSSSSAVNVGPNIRLLVSSPDQNQRGSIVDVPGQLSDILPDPARNHLYVLRQDKNQLLVFDSNTFQQLATLPTGTTPVHMSFTADNKGLVVASKDSQFMQVFDLDALQPQGSILLPSSHYGMSVAQSNSAMLVVIENDSGGADCNQTTCAVDRVDAGSFCAYHPSTLGVFSNDNATFPSTSVVSASPDQRSIMLASPNGAVMLYSADRDTFILSRQDFSGLSGAYAVSSSASSPESGPSFQPRYIIGDNVFNAALVPQGTMDTSLGKTVGFTFTGTGGYRLLGTTATAAGVIQKVPDVMNPSANYSPVATAEAPVLSSKNQPFTRTVAPMNSGIALLTVSGFTVLAQDYDAAIAPPRIDAVVNTADGTKPVAPGGLISIYGGYLSPITAATKTIPLPTALANSCLVVNGIPLPLLFVSTSQINAQLPYSVSGSATLSVHTPGGISDSFNFPVQTAAPSVFLTGSAGPQTGLAAIIRADNNQLVTPTNPVHPKDTVVIYLTGMGSTYPSVDTGMPAPMSPLASASIPPTVTLGGAPLTVLFAGLVPGEVGVYQINATIPPGVPQGLEIPLTIDQGGSATTLTVRVVN